MRDESFLHAIIAEPDDDTHRLVYADWLEDEGDAARFEFIRVQCRLAKVPDYDPEWSTLRRREQALLDAHREEWLRPFAFVEDTVPEKDRYVFTRGFVETVKLTGSGFLRHGERLFDLTPVRRLSLVRFKSNFAKVLAHPCLPRARDLLLLNTRLSPSGFRRLAAAPALTAIRGLFLGSSAFDEDAAEIPAGSSHLARLEDLNLCWVYAGDDGMSALANSPSLAGLKNLMLSGAFFGAGGARAIAHSPWWAGLTNLSLGGAGSTPVARRRWPTRRTPRV